MIFAVYKGIFHGQKIILQKLYSIILQRALSIRAEKIPARGDSRIKLPGRLFKIEIRLFSAPPGKGEVLIKR